MATTTLGEGEVFNSNVNALAAIEHTKMAQRTNAVIPILFTDWRVWDALSTLLPATSATDDLGLTIGTFGSAATRIGTSDLKAAGSTTRYARCFVRVPEDFEGNSTTLTLRAYAGMVTTIADVAATIDFEVWRIDRDGTLGAADVCATSAQSINSLTVAAKDFDLTNATLLPGDTLDVRMTIVVNDAATATAVIAAVWDVLLLADLR